MSYSPGASTVGYQLSSEISEYVQRLIELGVFSGPLGNMTVNPAVQPLLDAINRVMAGGTVSVQVTTPGDPGIYKELGDYLVEGLKESNAINKAAGYYVTVGL